MVKISTNPRRGSGRAGLVAREGKADFRDGGLGGMGRATSRWAHGAQVHPQQELQEKNKEKKTEEI